jgi:predicted transcriptional regulator
METGLNSQLAVNTLNTSHPKHSGISRRRSDIKIIADMLRAGEKGAGKTEIMYSANMSFSQIQKYLDYLVSQGFIHKVDIDNTLKAYQVTDSGLKLLKAIDNLISMLEPTR